MNGIGSGPGGPHVTAAIADRKHTVSAGTNGCGIGHVGHPYGGGRRVDPDDGTAATVGIDGEVMCAERRDGQRTTDTAASVSWQANRLQQITGSCDSHWLEDQEYHAHQQPYRQDGTGNPPFALIHVPVLQSGYTACAEIPAIGSSI